MSSKQIVLSDIYSRFNFFMMENIVHVTWGLNSSFATFCGGNVRRFRLPNAAMFIRELMLVGFRFSGDMSFSFV